MTSTLTKDPSTRTQASFLGLPGEIRNKIYRLVLVSTNIRHTRFVWLDRNHLSLLLTNHQIYAEASSILYSERRFEVNISPLLLHLPNLLTSWFPNANAGPRFRDGVSRSPHHLVLDFDYIAPCGCRSHRMSSEDYKDLRTTMNYFCSTVLPRLTELESVEVVWSPSIPVGDMCHMDDVDYRIRMCTKLLNSL